MYAKGLGGDKNIFRAIMWFERASQQDDTTAQKNLRLLKENAAVTAAMLEYTANVQKAMAKIKGGDE